MRAPRLLSKEKLSAPFLYLPNHNKIMRAPPKKKSLSTSSTLHIWLFNLVPQLDDVFSEFGFHLFVSHEAI